MNVDERKLNILPWSRRQMESGWLAVHSTISAKPMDGNFIVIHTKPFGNLSLGFSRMGRGIDIEQLPALITTKMIMLAHIGTVPRGAFRKIDGFDESALYQSIEAIINRCHGDVWMFRLGSDEDFFGRRMIQLLQKHAIDVLALGRKSKTAVRQTRRQHVFFAGVLVLRTHGGNLTPTGGLSILGIILNKNW